MRYSLDAEQAYPRFEAQLRILLEDRSQAYLTEALKTGVWIYGAGNYGRQIAALIANSGYEICGFIDKRGDAVSEIGGISVIHPKSFTADLAQGRCFVLGIFNPAVDADDILPFAESFPFRERLWNADVPEALGPLANTMCLSSRLHLRAHLDQIQKVAIALKDAVSIETYFALLLNRITGRRADYPAYNLKTQYLPPDLPQLSAPITFVDGGAYTGDTGVMLLDKGVRLSEWLAFEPDIGNFTKLAQTVRDRSIPGVLFPCGLSDHQHQVSFESDLGMASRITEGVGAASTVIQCVAFDDVLPGHQIDFVKLDIEGAEIAALDGMSRTIARSAPRLAVSAYHKPQDLWEIPLKLLQLLPAAQLYIRQHDHNGLETVAYIIP